MEALCSKRVSNTCLWHLVVSQNSKPKRRKGFVLEVGIVWMMMLPNIVQRNFCFLDERDEIPTAYIEMPYYERAQNQKPPRRSAGAANRSIAHETQIGGLD
jgi:hypothetical protein